MSTFENTLLPGWYADAKDPLVGASGEPYKLPSYWKNVLLAFFSFSAGWADVILVVRTKVFVALLTGNLVFAGVTLAPDVAARAGVFLPIYVYFLIVLGNACGVLSYHYLRELPRYSLWCALVCAGMLTASQLIRIPPKMSTGEEYVPEWVQSVLVSFTFGLQNALTLEGAIGCNTSYHTGNFHKVSALPYLLYKGVPREKLAPLMQPFIGLSALLAGSICAGGFIGFFSIESIFGFLPFATLQVVAMALNDFL
ncbi:hypothetical protein M885DRAFT_572580 [Pelagophyceae sp. CCMP2097]|nr:hypothetical protein M885DRAFT_572580 [Pelagophyceae sp. CCMP2097]